MDQSFISDVVVVFTRKNCWMKLASKIYGVGGNFFFSFFSILYVYDLQMRYVFRSLFVNGFVAKCPYFVVMHGRELQHTVPKINFLSKNSNFVKTCRKITLTFSTHFVLKMTNIFFFRFFNIELRFIKIEFLDKKQTFRIVCNFRGI